MFCYDIIIFLLLNELDIKVMLFVMIIIKYMCFFLDFFNINFLYYKEIIMLWYECG